MVKFRKKPVVIDAWQLDISNTDETIIQDNGIPIPTLEGEMLASDGDWIIQGVNGEFYPCKPDIFEKTYEAVDGIS